jgi:5'-nucleotidase
MQFMVTSSDTRDPLILVTNDDGVTSPGLRAAVQAALPLGDVLVAAPARQWSGAGRSMPAGFKGQAARYPVEVNGQEVESYQVDTSPALVVVYAMLRLAPRRPALLISGVNYGENLGIDVTASGTVGAALQGAAFGIPALAVSLQTPKETHNNPSDSVDFAAALHFTRSFARWMLQVKLPFDVDVLKIDVPDDATPMTPWRLTHVSRRAYFVAASPRQDAPGTPVATHTDGPIPDRTPRGIDAGWRDIDYAPLLHPEHDDPDSDIYALAVDRVVSVAPLSIDLASRVDQGEMEALLRGPYPGAAF